MKTPKKITPMMGQYMAVKKQHPDKIILFRLGDFYEMFWDDAVEASRLLGLTLTKRGSHGGQNIPMCGVPYHAAESYIRKLVQKQKRVAICEQIGDPKTTKGIVKRAVTRIISPSTTLDDQQLTGKSNNFLVALCQQMVKGQPIIGLAFIDISTGLFELTQLNSQDDLQQELVRIQPSEILLHTGCDFSFLEGQPAFDKALTVPTDQLFFDDGKNILLMHFKVHSLEGFGCHNMPAAIAAAGAALRYVQENLLESDLGHISSLRVFNREKFMILGDVSRRNLELTRALRDGSTHGTLLGILDNTVTPMGARLLLQWINAPLLDPAEISQRQNAIEALISQQQSISAIRAALDNVYDIERLTSRLSTGYGSPRDLAGLRESLHAIPLLKQSVEDVLSAIKEMALVEVEDDKIINQLLENLKNELIAPPKITNLLERALVDTPPLKVQEGGIIKASYNQDLDDLRSMSHNGKDWITKLQTSEAKRTGIRSLKVGFNKVFGYYLEVTRTNQHLVPENYIRKQTISTGERFITPELKEIESQILTAEERAKTLEYQLFQDLRMQVVAHNLPLQALAKAVALLDVIQNLAFIALQRNYCRPIVDNSSDFIIKAGRHPVVERLLPEQEFVPNNTELNNLDAQIMIITGPNMSGKSTYIRQVALITLMAQIGSFIPANEAKIGIIDRIFTRVGARDELTRGQSTFMVEMTETANILNNATKRSLIILDEIGRGTSTYDGLSIAWSVVEYLHNYPKVKAKTLFATHYHELIQLEQQLQGVVNYNVDVREYNDEVIFLHEIVKGGTNRSYGIHVAKLAGIPNPVIERAQNILSHLENNKQETANSEILVDQEKIDNDTLDDINPTENVTEDSAEVWVAAEVDQEKIDNDTLDDINPTENVTEDSAEICEAAEVDQDNPDKQMSLF